MCAAYPARSKCPSQAAACRVEPRRAGTSCYCCCSSFAKRPRTPVVRQHVPHIAAQTAVRKLRSRWQHCVLATFCSQTSVGSTMCVCVCVCVCRHPVTVRLWHVWECWLPHAVLAGPLVKRPAQRGSAFGPADTGAYT